MPELSIIIPTKDRGAIFFKTLNKIIESVSHINVEIIVINNSYSPIDLVNKLANVFIYDNPHDKNSVFSSRNYGASLAKSPILLFIDDDIIISKESIDYAISFHQEHSNACFNVNWQYPPELINRIENTIFGGYLIKHGFTAMKSLYHGTEWRDDRPFISVQVASFFFCIRKNDFIKFGGYNEKLLHEGNDTDISLKLNKNNIIIWINPLITVYHNEEDRVNILNWLERKKRVGIVHRIFVNMGDESQKLYYSLLKRIAYRAIYVFQPLILTIITKLDTLKIKRDRGFILVDILLGANMFKGYYSIK